MKIPKKHQLFTYLVLALLLIAIPVSIVLVGQRQELRQKAAAATTLTLTPANITKAPGDRFAMDIMVDTGSNTISAAKIAVSFDGTKLQAEKITPGDFLTVILESGSVGGEKASIALGSSPTAPKKGAGKLAIITFKAKGSTGTTQVSFDNTTEVAGIGEQTNVLTGKGSSTVTITSGQPQLTLTPTPKQLAKSNKPTATPTPSPGGFGTGSRTLGTPDLTLSEITPIPQPGETIKDPAVIAYAKLILEFIKSLLGK